MPFEQNAGVLYNKAIEGRSSMYDHAADPDEWINVASFSARSALKSKLAKWLPAMNVKLGKERK